MIKMGNIRQIEKNIEVLNLMIQEKLELRVQTDIEILTLKNSKDKLKKYKKLLLKNEKN